MIQPLVSIVIPCYNAAPYVRAALQSAFIQTWGACEVILVDDGSTDQSVSIAREFESTGLQVIIQKNRGASAARNAGLDRAQGDYIQFLDADDVLAPDKIEQQIRGLSGGGPRVLWSGAWARFQIDPSEAVFTSQANWKNLTGVEFLQLHYEEGCMMQPAAWLTPRSLLTLAGPWDESLSLNDDGEYFARVMLRAERISFCPNARSYYRSGVAGSLSRRKDQRALISLYRSVELTVAHLLAADRSARTLSAAAFAWKWAAFELYPGAPALARTAEGNSKKLGGSSRPFPGSGRFLASASLVGWRMAKRLFP